MSGTKTLLVIEKAELDQILNELKEIKEELKRLDCKNLPKLLNAVDVMEILKVSRSSFEKLRRNSDPLPMRKSKNGLSIDYDIFMEWYNRNYKR